MTTARITCDSCKCVDSEIAASVRRNWICTVPVQLNITGGLAFSFPGCTQNKRDQTTACLNAIVLTRTPLLCFYCLTMPRVTVMKH